MIASLKGTIHRLNLEEVCIDVNGVGYRVHVPVDIWDDAIEGDEILLHTSTYVREDRFDLFGFKEPASRALFEALIQINGIGPKSAMELCAVPRSLLLQAIELQDSKLLTSVKGIGKKTGERLLIDLKSLTEKHPDLLGSANEQTSKRANRFDQDAVDALTTLGYDTPTILKVLQNLPEDLGSTEERVAEALRAL